MSLLLVLAAAILPAATVADKQVAVEPPNLYTDFHFDTRAPYSVAEIFFRWEVAPSPMQLYQAFNFRFQADQGGYMGPQIVGSSHKVLFSIWDIYDGAGTAVPLGDCGPFPPNGEGTGARCLKDFNWNSQHEYRLRLERYASDETGAYWRGTIDNFVIGEIKLLNTYGYSGYGGVTNNTSVFLEFFGSSGAACEGQPYTRLRWRGPYADGVQASSAYIPFYRSCDRGNVSSPGAPITLHEAGGATTTTVPAGVNPWGYSGTPPPATPTAPPQYCPTASGVAFAFGNVTSPISAGQPVSFTTCVTSTVPVAGSVKTYFFRAGEDAVGYKSDPVTLVANAPACVTSNAVTAPGAGQPFLARAQLECNGGIVAGSETTLIVTASSATPTPIPFPTCPIGSSVNFNLVGVPAAVNPGQPATFDVCATSPFSFSGQLRTYFYKNGIDGVGDRFEPRNFVAGQPACATSDSVTAPDSGQPFIARAQLWCNAAPIRGDERAILVNAQAPTPTPTATPTPPPSCGPPPHYVMCGGSCLPSCGALGGTYLAPPAVSCASLERPYAGLAYEQCQANQECCGEPGGSTGGSGICYQSYNVCAQNCAPPGVCIRRIGCFGDATPENDHRCE